MTPRLAALLVLAVLPVSASAQDVQIDFDTWPEAPCTTPGIEECELAWVHPMPAEPADEMRIRSCGIGMAQCLRARWSAEGDIRPVKTPWAPEAGLRAAYAQIKIRFENDYDLEAAPFGWAGPDYQPLIRFHDETGDFGIDVALVNNGSREPYLIIASAPDTPSNGRRHDSRTGEACSLQLPRLRGRFWTIEAEIALDPTVMNGDACELRVDGETSAQTGIDFRGTAALSDSQVELRTVSFLGRASNENDPCDGPPWPPCGGEDLRTVTVDDLCVSDRFEAATDGTCEPGDAALPDAALPDASTGSDVSVAIDPRTGFRGVGGCECSAAVARRRSPTPWLFGALALLVFRRLRRRSASSRPGMRSR